MNECCVENYFYGQLAAFVYYDSVSICGGGGDTWDSLIVFC